MTKKRYKEGNKASNAIIEEKLQFLFYHVNIADTHFFVNGGKMIQISEVKTKREMRKFVSFPLRIYKNCKQQVKKIINMVEEINV